VVLSLLTTTSYAVISNGGFEEIEPNGLLDFDPPACWARENYAGVMERFFPTPSEGNTSNWKIDPEIGLRPAEGDTFIVVSSGEIDPDPYYGLISQEVYVLEGQTIFGYYFFGTSEWDNYYDTAFIKMQPLGPNSNPRGITLVSTGVAVVGEAGSMERWKRFEHTFTSEEEGGYSIVIRVDDYEDFVYPSYLAVDGMSLCDYKPVGDLNGNCRVDFSDFSLLANDWLQDCNDPNYLADPNNCCVYGTDIDENGPVDMNDMMYISDYWLEHE
jgi:hypothetical protein